MIVIKKVVVLGSTGSVGRQCLSVCKERGYEVTAVSGHSNIDLLTEQALKFKPRYAVTSDTAKYKELKAGLNGTGIKVLAGAQALCEIASLPHDEADIVVNSVVGIAALRPTLSAIENGHDIALSNKEAIVTAGDIIIKKAYEHNVNILPVDSEHSAILQCLRAGERDEIERIILTASGGPFFGRTKAQLKNVSVGEALKHPNWKMGSKITIDSATLMNKGLEFLEAMFLFEVSPEKIEVVVHRQSVVHSAVAFCDGALIAQLGVPDMRCAIQYALTYPQRMPLSGERLSLIDYASLDFAKPDTGTFTCLGACINAAFKGGLAPAVINGANEAAVELFLAGEISFLQIGELVCSSLDEVKPGKELTLDSVEEADILAREYVYRKANSRSIKKPVV